MKDELELKLQEDFPFMKQNHVNDESNIYRRWGCECSGGWYDLIHDCCQAITDMSRLLEYLKTVYSKDLIENEGKFERIAFNKKTGCNEKTVEIYVIEEKECPNISYKEYSIQIKGPQANNACYTICNNFYSFYRGKETGDDGIKYLLGCVIPVEGKFFEDEFDRTSDAFALYTAVHSQKIITKNRSKKYFYKYEDEKDIEISGDCDFNFHMQHVLYFQNILETKCDLCEATRKELINKLYFYYSELMYSPNNISIMPVSGGLNNTKKSIGNDRFDVFIFALKMYFEDDCNSLLLSSGKQGVVYWDTIHELQGYLDSFRTGKKENDLNNYCKQIYHIDSELVKLLWKSGQKAIDSAKRVEEYLKLADDVWAAMQKFYSETKDVKIKDAYDKLFKFVQQSKGKNISYVNENDEIIPIPRII